MTVTAHAGAFRTPANTLESIQRILDEKCEVLELDVTFRPDGTPVIIHLDEASENEGVLLDDALKLIASNESIKINLDLKSTKNLGAVEELIRHYGLYERSFCTGVNREFVPAVREQMTLPYYLNMKLNRGKNIFGFISKIGLAGKIARAVNENGAIGLNIHFSFMTEKLVAKLHERGVSVSVWTLDEEKYARKMIAYGVDNITSRRPDMIARLMSEK